MDELPRQLAMTDLTRTFDAEPPVRAVNGVSLTIERGEYVAIQGPSGSGKSTFLNLLALLDQPTSGEYRVGDTSTRCLTARDLARLRSDYFGFIFQSFHLMPQRSALENVALGLVYRGVPAARRRALAVEALRAVGLDGRRHTITSRLSGGERQRVAIARAMVGNPPFIVADEPTGNLDSRNGSAVVEQLREVRKAGSTVVLVTHDPDVAAQADRQITLRDGEVVADSGASAVERDVRHQPMRGRASTIRGSDLIRESVESLLAKPGRLATLVGSVALAVALAVITIGLSQSASAQVGQTFDATLNRQVTATLTMHDQLDRLDVADLSRRAGQLAGVTASAAVETFETVTAALPGTPRETDVTALASSASFAPAASMDVVWSRGHDSELSSREAVVGAHLANELGIGPLELDPQIEVNGVTFVIVGEVRDGGRLPAAADGVILGSGDADVLGSPSRADVLLTTRPGAAQQVARQVSLVMQPTDPGEVAVAAPVDPSTLRSTIQGEVKSALFALTAVALLASILGVANSMLMGVIERIGEMGLRRAIGARPVHILGQTTLESFLVGLGGGFVGLLFGVATILAVTLAKRWQPTFDLWIAPLAIVAGVLVGAVGGLPASFRATRIQPADALRR